jgi:DNA repair protein RecO (recombination protein O)
MPEKATALVVRATDWSETSRIATLFTREFGKVRALAKGGRRLKSSFEIAFDLLTVCEIVVIRKHSGGLDLLTEARLVEKFPALRADLPELYCGYYIAELLADGTADYDPHPALFDAAVAILRDLAENPKLRPSRLGAFELVWLRELGYSPRLDGCAACGTPLPETVTRVRFSPAAGGLVCSSCHAADPLWLARATLEQLRQLASDAPKPVELAKPICQELRAVLSQTICYLLAKRPKLLGYIEADF